VSPAVTTEPVFRSDGDLLVPTANAKGPWFDGVLHGGAVAAAVARAVEALPSAQPMQLTRLTLDLSRKVPHEPIRTVASVLRDGRRVQSVGVEVLHGEDVVCRASAMRVRIGEGIVPDDDLPEALAEDVPPPPPESAEPYTIEGAPFDFVRCFELRRVGEAGPGRGTTWYRFLPSLVDEEPATPTVRVAATADLVMSAGSIVGFQRYLSANPDLSLHVQRLPEGPWICLASTARVDGRGIGQSDGVLFDRSGRLGRAMKSLLVDPR
jgi:acyl-CoA thioesterase